MTLSDAQTVMEMIDYFTEELPTVKEMSTVLASSDFERGCVAERYRIIESLNNRLAQINEKEDGDELEFA